MQFPKVIENPAPEVISCPERNYADDPPLAGRPKED
jgi:hypothetical protein